MSEYPLQFTEQVILENIVAIAADADTLADACQRLAEAARKLNTPESLQLQREHLLFILTVRRSLSARSTIIEGYIEQIRTLRDIRQILLDNKQEEK